MLASDKLSKCIFVQNEDWGLCPPLLVSAFGRDLIRGTMNRRNDYSKKNLLSAFIWTPDRWFKTDFKKLWTSPLKVSTDKMTPRVILMILNESAPICCPGMCIKLILCYNKWLKGLFCKDSTVVTPLFSLFYCLPYFLLLTVILL